MNSIEWVDAYAYYGSKFSARLGSCVIKILYDTSGQDEVYASISMTVGSEWTKDFGRYLVAIKARGEDVSQAVWLLDGPSGVKKYALSMAYCYLNHVKKIIDPIVLRTDSN